MSTLNLYGLCGAAPRNNAEEQEDTAADQVERKDLAQGMRDGEQAVEPQSDQRGAGYGLAGDPVPQALVITGIVVAFSATALAVALLLRLHEETGSASLSPPESGEPPTV